MSWFICNDHNHYRRIIFPGIGHPAIVDPPRLTRMIIPL